MSDLPTAAAVVVRYGGGDEVLGCLRTLVEHGPGHELEILLVDSGSGDGKAAQLAAQAPPARLLELAENRSFAWAAAQGVASISAEHIFLLNPDAEVQAGALPTLRRELAERPHLAAVVPVLENPDGSSQHRWQLRRLPTPGELALGRAGRPAFSTAPSRSAPVPQPAAAAWLIRREVWERLDGLDPLFAPAWWEDVDFCRRLSSLCAEGAAPWNDAFRVFPAARVRHRGGSSLSSLEPGTFLRVYYSNLLRYAARHHPQQFSRIRSGLRMTLHLKALLRPSQRVAYRQALRAVAELQVDGGS